MLNDMFPCGVCGEHISGDWASLTVSVHPLCGDRLGNFVAQMYEKNKEVLKLREQVKRLLAPMSEKELLAFFNTGAENVEIIFMGILKERSSAK